jgi:hypothetical protein
MLTLLGSIAVARVGDHHIKIGKRVYPIDGYAMVLQEEIRGFDAILVSLEDADRIANQLMQDGSWELGCAEEGLFDDWVQRRPIHFEPALLRDKMRGQPDA